MEGIGANGELKSIADIIKIDGSDLRNTIFKVGMSGPQYESQDSDANSNDDSAIKIKNLFVKIIVIKKSFCGAPAIVLFIRNMTDSVRKRLLKIYKFEQK